MDTSNVVVSKNSFKDTSFVATFRKPNENEQSINVMDIQKKSLFLHKTHCITQILNPFIWP